MFVGHYGVAYAAKAMAPRVPLGVIFIAVQWVDVMFSVFVLLGIEKMRIVPGFTQYNPYDFYFMPYTHSLAGALGWSIAAGLIWFAARRSWREALVVGGAVFSHFVLDLPVHTPDMPLAGEGTPKLGLGLWNHWQLALALELVVLLAGFAFWIVRRGASARPGEIALLVLLFVLGLATPFLPPPSSLAMFGVQALGLYALLALLAQATEIRWAYRQA